MKELLKNADKMFSLELDDLGQHVLRTMCGGIGMFEVSIVLTSEEVERFHSEGNEFIDELAYDVGRDIGKYKTRWVSPS